MKRFITFLSSIVLCVTIVCGCERNGPFPPPVNQNVDQIVSVKLVFAQNENALYDEVTHESCVLYTLKSDEISSFMEMFNKIEFDKPFPGMDFNTELGDLAVWIQYQDGNCDIIGYSSNRYLNTEYKRLTGKWWYYTDKSAYVDLFSEYIDIDGMIQ